MCPNDPLVFTCEVNDAAALRVILPSGLKDTVSLGYRASDISLPAGFTANCLEITPVGTFTRNTRY